MVIVSLSSEPFDLKILGGGVFKIARNLMVRFDPAKVKVTEGQLRIARPSYQRSRFAEM